MRLTNQKENSFTANSFKWAITAISLILALTFTSSFAVADKKPKELLQDIDANKALQLEEYNSVFLQDILYFASRHKIVKANTELLYSDDEFTITPFQDVEALHFKQTNVSREIDQVQWFGQMNLPIELQKRLDERGVRVPIQVSMHAWDLDPNGNASSSRLNRFKHSPYWTFDETGTPVLETVPGGTSAIAGPPPQTPEDIERHKKLKQLKKHDFFSVRTAFSSLTNGKRYVLRPLKYTPKYSVLIEVDNQKVFAGSYDYHPEAEHLRSQYEISQAEAYNTFKQSLPKEENKRVRGDLD